MIQILAAIFFFGAWLVPLAIIAAMLQQNWQSIANALLGGIESEPLAPVRPARIRESKEAPLPSVRRLAYSVRAAA